jgi:hypothetical protein
LCVSWPRIGSWYIMMPRNHQDQAENGTWEGWCSVESSQLCNKLESSTILPNFSVNESPQGYAANPRPLSASDL